MSVQKKSLISNRSAVKKALVAKSAGKVAEPSKIATPVRIHQLSKQAVGTPYKIAHLSKAGPVHAPAKIAQLSKTNFISPTKF